MLVNYNIDYSQRSPRLAISVHEWHQRYLLQTRWTRELTNYLFQKARITTSDSILEVGCGTGAVLHELVKPSLSNWFGLDINLGYLFYARENQPQYKFIAGDAHLLPFGDNSFDVCLCHFLLLWLTAPSIALQEMRRVTRSGGVVMALAEPDYGGRIDYPDELSVIGKWQTDSLLQQGADPLIGRKLRTLFAASGLNQIEAGVLGGEWKTASPGTEQESEWAVIRSDLAQEPEKLSRLDKLYRIDQQAQEHNERILFVPTFYAWGRVP